MSSERKLLPKVDMCRIKFNNNILMNKWPMKIEWLKCHTQGRQKEQKQEEWDDER
jgi:ribosomal protein L24E